MRARATGSSRRPAAFGACSRPRRFRTAICHSGGPAATVGNGWLQRRSTSRRYAAHCEPLLLFLARRTADPQVALDRWAETFAHAAAGLTRYRGGDDEVEAAGWLYAIARPRLALYYRRGRCERRALDRLKLERPPADPGVLAEIERRAGRAALRGARVSRALAALAALLDTSTIHEAVTT